jgi:hypothetical protein
MSGSNRKYFYEIRAFGFGLIELLVVLVFIALLSAAAVRHYKKYKENVLPNMTVLEGRLNSILENKETRITAAGTESLVFDEAGTIVSLELAGNRPSANLILNKGGTRENLVDRVSWLRFTYYKDGKLVLDDDAKRDPGRISAIKISLAFHDGTEKPDFFTDDGISGVDLDGDKANGTAKLTRLEKILTIK